MKTLGLEDAAQMLMMSPKVLSLKACAGEIPAAKPDKPLVFIDLELFDWLRTQSTSNRQDVRELLQLVQFLSVLLVSKAPQCENRK